MQHIHGFTLKLIVGCLMWLLMAVSTQALAVPVKGLYTATAEVADQSKETRNAALPAMMREVVGRLVGEPDSQQLAGRWPELSAEFRAANRYLAQFLYQRVAASDSESQLILRAEFEASALNRMIQRYQLPQWGADRPEVLVVVAWSGDGRRDVLSSSPNSQLEAELLSELEQVAASSGLPIALPLMDLQDQRYIPEQELRAGFTDGLLDVADRYGADAVLLGRAKILKSASVESEDAIQGSFAERNGEFNWTLLQTGQEERYADDLGNVESGLQSGLWMALRALAQRYAVQASSSFDPLIVNVPKAAKVNVLGVNDLVALKRVEKHLKERTVVASSVLEQTKLFGQERLAVFHLELQGDVEKLEQALAVGRLLAPTFNPQQFQPASSSQNPLAEPTEAGELVPANSLELTQEEPLQLPTLWYRLR